MTDSISKLHSLYGDSSLEQLTESINRLQRCSNIPFDNDYIHLGLSFLDMKMQNILDGTKEKASLEALVKESFGEAAITKYNT